MSNESVRHSAREVAADGPRQTVPLDRDEAVRLLEGAPLGRVVFTEHALPAIRPVNHVLDEGRIIIRTHEGAALTSAVHDARGLGTVVAYEADSIDPLTHLGWSVVVTGYARPVTLPAELDRYRALFTPWFDAEMDHVVRITPELVTGVRFIEPHRFQG
jgi:hypothetical protein